MGKYDPKLVRDFLDKNPEGTYNEFAIKTGCKMVPSNFNYLRKRYFAEKSGKLPAKEAPGKPGKRPYSRRNPLSIYSQVYITPVESLLKDPKAVLADLISVLNKSGRTNWELVEMANPNNLEIRELTKR